MLISHKIYATGHYINVKTDRFDTDLLTEHGKTDEVLAHAKVLRAQAERLIEKAAVWEQVAKKMNS